MNLFCTCHVCQSGGAWLAVNEAGAIFIAPTAVVPRSGLEQNLCHLEHFCSRVQAPAPRSRSTRRVPCFQLGKHCLDPKFHEESESGLRSRQSPLLACENVSCCLAPGCQLVSQPAKICMHAAKSLVRSIVEHFCSTLRTQYRAVFLYYY